jgi:hypothetical protein
MVEEGFLAAGYRDMVARDSEPAALLERLTSYRPPGHK